MSRPVARFVRIARLALATVAILAGVAATAEPRYPEVRPGAPPVFPRDHGAHPDHRIEWWYLTGWLDADAGAAGQTATGTAPQRPLGFQLTFFRLRPGAREDNPSAFAPRQLLFAHAALADPARGRLLHAEKSARAGFGLAFAETGETRVGIDDWVLQREAAAGGERYLARARSEGFAIDLVAVASAAPLLQGESGYSRKGAGARHASYYYSRPQLAVTGTVEHDGRTVAVRGRGWLDHEWSSEAMPPGAVGWDWLGANLDNGGALMAFRLRDAEGRALWAGGTLALPGKPPRRFGPAEVSFTPLRRWTSPRTGGAYAVEMRVDAGGTTWRLAPLLDDQEIDARGSVGAVYWEGAVRVLGESGTEAGRGYLEMTGVVARIRL